MEEEKNVLGNVGGKLVAWRGKGEQQFSSYLSTRRVERSRYKFPVSYSVVPCSNNSGNCSSSSSDDNNNNNNSADEDGKRNSTLIGESGRVKTKCAAQRRTHCRADTYGAARLGVPLAVGCLVARFIDSLRESIHLNFLHLLPSINKETNVQSNEFLRWPNTSCVFATDGRRRFGRIASIRFVIETKEFLTASLLCLRIAASNDCKVHAWPERAWEELASQEQRNKIERTRRFSLFEDAASSLLDQNIPDKRFRSLVSYTARLKTSPQSKIIANLLQYLRA